MATTSGNTGSAVNDPADDPALSSVRQLLTDEIFRVEFFQAVRLLERIGVSRNAVGYFVAPGSEAIRFRSIPSLVFAASQLEDLTLDDDGQWHLAVNFMGLAASFSPLPHVYTEHLIARHREKDTAMAEFFDLFNHRLISFFYRGWRKYRFFVGYEAGHNDELSPRLRDLLGLGTAALANRTSLPDGAYLAFTGLLGRHVRTAAALEQLLEEYFDIEVHVEQFVGAWRSLPPTDHTVMTGRNRDAERLGVGSVIGDEVWDQQGRVRISLGPMSFERYAEFLPGASAYEDLRTWLRFYSGNTWEAEVQLILRRAEAPSTELGAMGATAPRLGLVTWLKTKPLLQDPGDAVFLLT